MGVVDTAHGSTAMPDAAASLARCFAVLDPQLRLTPVPVTEDLYAQLDRRFNLFKGHLLIAEYAFDTDWPTWECHPAGDELVMLQAGRATLRLREAGGDRDVLLAAPGDYAIVPAGTWHTARVAEPTRMLFMTPGEGTENREAPP
jgi:mannose-6-phosphate isomerase-like protein (cupin superfamily)